jgi:hypothetical protein
LGSTLSFLQESAQRSEVHTCATPEEEMCVESYSPSMKLFGKTVAVKSVRAQKISTDNSFSDEEMAAEPESTPVGLIPAEATWSSWNTGTLQILYYMPSLPAENFSPVAVAPFPLWGPCGLMSHPQVKPPESQCLHSDNTASKDMRRAGSSTGSSSISDGDRKECQNVDPIESGESFKKVDSLIFSSFKERKDKPIRGFVPYKRCIVETQKIEVKVTADDGDSELTRLCL